MRRPAARSPWDAINLLSSSTTNSLSETSEVSLFLINYLTALSNFYLFVCLFFFLVVQEVPSMGDSITEGVVESYVKSKCFVTLIHPTSSILTFLFRFAFV